MREQGLRNLIVNTLCMIQSSIDIHPDEFEKVMGVLKHVSADDEDPHRSCSGAWTSTCLCCLKRRVWTRTGSTLMMWIGYC